MRQTVGRYRLTNQLGEGGMGVVYAARDDQLDRAVAIKMIREATADHRSRERLLREARSAAQVNHPNICQLYEVGEEDGELFIAMELMEGESLADRISQGPLQVAEAMQTALSILAALEALHRRGLVHRDLKPSNVFLTPVGLKLLDFGLARPIEGSLGQTEVGLTLPGTIVGTPHYIAPEQLRGERVDARSDLFAAGTVTFEMLNGTPPFGGTAPMEVLHAILYDEPPVLGGSPAVTALDRIIHRALIKNPNDRYQTADAMMNDLRAAMLLAETGGPARAVRMTRLMVLPFRILRPDPDTDFLAFSLPDVITSSLSGLESLVVRSSVTASRFASDAPDLEAIAEKADVDIVLTGTLLRAGDQVQVNTQLVEAPRGAVLWSQTSQVPLGEFFHLQDDLKHRIVDSLALPLTARDQRTLRHDVPASAKAYELYLRANQLGTRAQDWSLARDLYLECLELDPRYAPAWARLGRIYRVLGKYGDDHTDDDHARAQDAFTRALEINPDLSIAHNLYTNLEVELGRAKDAMLRLVARTRDRTGDPELFAGLVQACRYCGLLDASIAAYEQARRLDPSVRTSVAHAYLARGDYGRAIETNVEDPPDLTAAALALMGREDEAIALLRGSEGSAWPKIISYFLISYRTLLEGKRAECLAGLDQLLEAWNIRDPCARYYLARMLAQAGDQRRALTMLRQSVEDGFFCFPLLTQDPWLDSLRTNEEFRAILRHGELCHRDALAAFLHAGGDQVLGLVGRP